MSSIKLSSWKCQTKKFINLFYQSNEVIIFHIQNQINRKRKNHDISQEKYKLMNNIILAILITPPSKDIKNSIQSKFTKQNAIMISQFIGKYNTFSVSTIKMIFQVVDKFILPFQNSTKAVRFLYNLIRFIWKRKEKQRKAKIRLDKLLEKEKKQQQKEKNKQLSKESIDINQQTLAQQLQIPDQIGKNQEINQDQDDNQDQIQSDQEKDKQQGMEEQLNQGEQQMLSNQLEQKKIKCLRILKNQLSDQIMDQVKKGIQKLFNYIYFVNSKKTVPQFIRYSFIIMPQLIIKSLDLLDKASEIPYINEEGLVANIKTTVQYMFMPQILKDSLQNLRRILDRIINCSKISQVWSIYQLLCSKLPLLDEKDLQKIPQKDKELFQKKYQLNHDRFYQAYSGNVFQAFKRMLRQGQYLDQYNDNSISKCCFQQIITNSYHYFKKLLIQQVMQQITQNRKNQFVYNFFNQSFVLTPQNEQIILEQLNLINQNDVQGTVQLRMNLVMILCYHLPFQKLKKYIRQFASKNHYRTIPNYYQIRADLQLKIQPVDSALKYFEQNPKIKFIPTRTLNERLQAIQEVRKYSEELVQQLYTTVLKSSSSTNIVVGQDQIKMDHKSTQQLTQIISNLYKVQNQSDSTSTAKITLQNIGTRKKIAQIIRLLYSVMCHLQHKIIDYDAQTMKYQSIQPLTKRQSLFQNSKFIEIFYTLITNQTYLHDVKLCSILSQLITHQIIYNYGNQSRNNKDKIVKCILMNSFQELPEYCNRTIAMEAFMNKMRLIHSSKLLNEVKKQRLMWIANGFVSQLGNNQEKSQILFNKIINQLKILIASPGNQKSSCIIKTILITNGLKNIQQFIISLYKHTQIESRFYWEKLNQIFQQFKNYGLKFSIEQIIQLIEYHGKIIAQTQNKKIKEIILKSFKNIVILIKEQDINLGLKDNNQKQNSDKETQYVFTDIQKIERILRKYIEHQKLKFVWLLSVNIILTSRKFMYFHNDNLKLKMLKMQTIWDFMRMLQPMVLSQTRIIRRLALFMYSLCFRKVKKIMRTYQIKKVDKIQYKSKNINQLIETGYLRNQHLYEQKRNIETQDGKIIKLKRVERLQKTSPYDNYQVSIVNKKDQLYELYQKIYKQSFQFVLKDQQTSYKFINNFHTDMVSTAQQFLSMASNIQRPTELSQLIIKQLQESFYFFIPKKLNFQRIQLYFGQRFFKYLIIKDSRNEYKFLFTPKVQQIIYKSLGNLQSLDNQSLIFILVQDIMNAYQKYYNQLTNQAHQKIQKMITQVYLQTAKKASGNIFKRWGTIFKKIQNQKSLQFLLSLMKKQITEDRKRISRNGLIYLTVKHHDLTQHVEIAKILLQNKLQLENSIINKIINTIMTLPQKYPINKQQAIQYKFIDFEKEIQNQTIEKSTQMTYYIKNTQFKNYLIYILKSYVDGSGSSTYFDINSNVISNNQNQKYNNQDKKQKQQNKVNQQKQITQKKQSNQNKKQIVTNSSITDFYKNAYSLILNAINCFCHCFQNQFNMRKIAQLVQLIQIMSLKKQQTQVIDYKQFQPILKVMFGYQYQKVQNYQIVLKAVLKLIKVIPSKRQAQILTIILHRPYNFLLFSESKYEQILYSIFTLQETTTNYKELMINLSVILSFRMIKTEKFVNLIATKQDITQYNQKKQLAQKHKILLKNAKSKRKLILLYQCQQLATLTLNKNTINMLLNESTKQRKNIWCRQLLSLRGKKQYLDDYQTYQIWKRVKENSNPYNYIV